MDPNSQPSTPQNVTPPVTPRPTPDPNGGSKKNLIMALIALAVLLAGGIAYGVYAYVSNTPENLMKSAVDNLSRQKTLAANLQITQGTAKDGVTYAGDVAFNTDATGSKNADVIFGIGSGDKRVGLNMVLLDGALYFKLSKAENIGSLVPAFDSTDGSPSFADSLKNLDDKWFEVTKDQVQTLAQAGGNDSVSGLSPSDAKKMLDLYGQHPFVKSDHTYADETIDGANSAHFSIKVDKNEEAAFLQSVKSANLDSIKVTDADITQVKNSSDATDAAAEIWISRADHTFKQIRVTDTKKGEESAVKLTFKSQLPTFDKLEKPSGSKPISELYNLLLGVSPEDASGFLQ